MLADRTVALRPVVEADASLVRALFVSARPELAMLPGDLVDLQLRAQRQQQDLDHPTGRREVIVDDGQDVGLLVTDRTPRALHVVDIAVLASAQSRGIGTAVLQRLISEARSTGLPVQLNVWSQNIAARRLYERLGFVHAEVEETADAYLSMQLPPSRSVN